VDWRYPLSVARKAFGARAIQGNLDPAELLGSGETIDAAVDRVMHEGLGGAHIFNLGHGIMKETAPDMALRAIRRAQAFDRRNPV
jgi:uroporphyrinogen decarboxylase